MKINEEQFNKASQKLSGVSLSNAQRKSMLEGIYANVPTPSLKAVPSPFSNFSMFFVRQRAFVALATMVLMVTGTAYASSGSLPGDSLYEMKVKVLEPIGLALHFDEESKNEYKIALLQERILELETLKSQGKIDSESELSSFVATQKNVNDLETSAIFDESGTNIEVSTRIEAYNKLVPEKLKVKSFISSTKDKLDGDNVSSTESTEDEDSEASQIINEVDDTVTDADDIVEKVLDEVSDTVTTPPTNGGSVLPIPVVPKVGL